PRPASDTASTGSSVLAAWIASVDSGAIGILKPIASPSPNDTPDLTPVKEPGPVATAILASRTPFAMCGNCMAIGVSRESNWSSSTRARPGSTSPMADRTDDVSMTRIIIRGPDQAAVAAQVLDRNVESPVDVEPLSPLDHHRQARRGDGVGGPDDHELRLLTAGERVLDRRAGHAVHPLGLQLAAHPGHGGELLHLAHEPVRDVPAAQPELVQAPALIDPRHESKRPALAQGDGRLAERPRHGD